jgi:hypothetical protein
MPPTSGGRCGEGPARTRNSDDARRKRAFTTARVVPRLQTGQSKYCWQEKAELSRGAWTEF